MTDLEIQRALFDAIARIAPEADPSSSSGSADLREEFDIDSMDFLGIVTTLHETLGVDIPERDYSRLTTVDSAVEYLRVRLDQR